MERVGERVGFAPIELDELLEKVSEENFFTGGKKLALRWEFLGVKCFGIGHEYFGKLEKLYVRYKSEAEDKGVFLVDKYTSATNFSYKIIYPEES